MHAPFFEINLGSYFEDIRLISKEKIKKAIDLAGAIGVNPVVIHPGYTFLVDKVRDVEERTRENFMNDLHEIYLYAKGKGVSIALENVYMPYFFFYDLYQFTKLHEAVPGIGMCLDVGHAFITKCTQGIKNPEDAILTDLGRIGIEHLFHVHLHNNLGVKDDHTFLQGNINLKRIVRGLDGLGYKGKIIIESYDMEEYGAAPVIERIEELRRESL
jgi:sugar phosphate isomerase/epimerase